MMAVMQMMMLTMVMINDTSESGNDDDSNDDNNDQNNSWSVSDVLGTSAPALLPTRPPFPRPTWTLRGWGRSTPSHRLYLRA